jgi:hypothetical protein
MEAFLSNKVDMAIVANPIRVIAEAKTGQSPPR